MISRSLVLVLAGVGALAAAPARAQGVIPDAPQLNEVLPPSGQRGATVDVVLNGQKLAGTKQLLCRFSAYPQLTPPKESGVKAEVLASEDAQVKARLTLPADTPPGLHEIRALTGQGVTGPQYFYVSQYAQTP